MSMVFVLFIVIGLLGVLLLAAGAVIVVLLVQRSKEGAKPDEGRDTDAGHGV